MRGWGAWEVKEGNGDRESRNGRNGNVSIGGRRGRKGKEAYRAMESKRIGGQRGNWRQGE